MNRLRALLLAVTVLSALGGCTLPADEMDPALIYRYQQWSTHNAPQPRVDPLRPIEGIGRTLPVVVDDTTGERIVRLSLQDALFAALANNLDVKVIAFDPAISRERVIEARAAFDWVVFANINQDMADRESLTFFSSDNGETTTAQAGLRKVFWQTGGQLEISYAFTRRELATPTTVLFNPSYVNSVAVQVTQPLLRNAGPDFTLAQVRIARVNYDISVAQFRAQVLDTIAEVQTLYWQLVRAHQELEIQRRLLDASVVTLDQVRARFGLDATSVQITQSAAAVATRRAAIIRARRAILDIQDRLIRAMNDPSLRVWTDVLLVPTTPPSRAPLEIDFADQLVTAMKYSPELEQARLAIAANDIQVRVAKDQLLPRLDLQAAATPSGLDRDPSQSAEDLWGLDYIDYSLGLAFEYPLGNRGAEAVLRRNRYERMRAVVTMQNTADQIAVAVAEALRQIDATYDEVAADTLAVQESRANLEAINARQEAVGAWDPSFLEYRLRAQENLAAAERAELEAIVDYNIAQANLARTTGTLLDFAGVVVTDAGDNLVRTLATEVQTPPIRAYRAPVPLPAPVPTPEPLTAPELPADLEPVETTDLPPAADVAPIESVESLEPIEVPPLEPIEPAEVEFLEPAEPEALPTSPMDAGAEAP